jgi:Alpha-L-fucosidase
LKRTIVFGALLTVSAVFTGGMVTSCGNAPFGSAGPTGIDTVAKLPRLPMITTDASLSPTLISPDSGKINSTAYPVLQWNQVTGASRYRLILSTSRYFSGGSVIDDSTFTAADTSKTILTQLSYSTTYYWVVNAKSANGNIGWSSVRNFTTKVDPVIQIQKDYIAQKFGMFIHFNMSTFTRYNYPDPQGEWETGKENCNSFNPDSLNLGQWADVAKSAHCKYVVLTSKHHGGFCLWPSQAPWSLDNPHSIVQSDWYAEHGQRDILREFVDSVRSRGLAPGFYYSIRDGANRPTIPFIKAQLRELLTNYGDIKVIWFDGWGWYVGYGAIPYDSIANLVHKLNDSLDHHTVIVENNHTVGKLHNSEIDQYEIPLDGPPLAFSDVPTEGNEPLRADKCWFWHPMNSGLLSTQFITNRIIAANAVNATYLLDVTPDTLGRIPQDQVQRMKEIGDAVISQGILPP